MFAHHHISPPFVGNGNETVNASRHFGNFTDSDIYNDEGWLRVTFCVLMGFLSITGTFGNLFVMLSVLTVRELRQLKNVFILNLSFSDFTINAISMPFNIAGALMTPTYWDGRETLCAFVSGICIPGCSSSLFSIAAIAFERYLCICHFALHRRLFTLRNCILMVIALWVNAWLLHIPNHIGWGGIYFDENFFICWLDLRLWSYSFFWAAFSVMIPIGFCFFAYFSIYQKIRGTTQSRRLIANHGLKVNPLDETEKIRRSTWVEEVILVKTLFKLFVIFLIMWGPVAVLFCFNKLFTPPRWINLLAIMMAHGNSAVNSLVYYFMTGHFTAAKRSLETQIMKHNSRVMPDGVEMSFFSRNYTKRSTSGGTGTRS